MNIKNKLILLVSLVLLFFAILLILFYSSFDKKLENRTIEKNKYRNK